MDLKELNTGTINGLYSTDQTNLFYDSESDFSWRTLNRPVENTGSVYNINIFKKKIL